MIEVIGVRFKKTGKVYYFDPEGIKIDEGVPVIVETARGLEYGITVIKNRFVEPKDIVAPLKKVLRIATDEDGLLNEENKIKEKEAFTICQVKIQKHKLQMKLIDVEITFDHNKFIFYFTSEGRVDFRDLVKDLASIFRTRIELRQIGVRDEAKMLNGIGICGRALCCATFLEDFQPVSIKMAKEQDLSLNPAKISGMCGRLMCCLKYEEETYEYLNKNLPSIGDTIKTKDGKAVVLSVNVLRQTVKASYRKNEQDEPAINYYALDEITILVPKKRKQKEKDKDEQLEELIMSQGYE